MNILLSGIVGSTAYGLANEDSDIDRLGVYAEPTTRFHGLRIPVERADCTHVTKDPDTTIHEARKFALLCLSSNPTVTELLWLNHHDICTDLGEQLVAIRSAFASAKRVRDAYFGYATSQLKRLLETGQFQSKMRKRQSKHGRHLLRLLDQGYGYYTTGELTIEVDDPQRYIDFGERVALDPMVANQALSDAETRFNSARSPLPEQPDEPLVEAWLQAVRLAHLDYAW